MSLRSCALLLAVGLWLDTPATAQVVYTNDFEEPIGIGLDEWGVPWWLRNTTPVGDRQFLGEFGETTVVTLQLSDLPDHGELTVSFDLFVIRSWDGNQTFLPGSGATIGPDVWELGIDGQNVIRTTFANAYPEADGSPGIGFLQAFPGDYVDETDHDAFPNQTGAIENYTLGYSFFGPLDSVYRMSFTVPHSEDSVAISFSSIGLQRISDESWGLDNVEVSVSQPFIPVSLDIKPGSDPNAVNLGSQGVIPVAILSTNEFDARTVDETTVELAGAGVAIRGRCNYLANVEDVNSDGRLDLVCHVETENLLPDSFQDGLAQLIGATFAGEPIQGWDEITVVPLE